MCRAVINIPSLLNALERARTHACALAYDAFGELASQTDARGVVTQIAGRDGVGRTLQRTQTPPASVPAGTANETLLDTYVYDATNALGQIKSITRTRAGTQTWSETYDYDTNARPSTTQTQINDSGSSVTLNSGQAYDSLGRLSTYTYPSGLVVQRSYTAYGQLDALYNAQTNNVYWVAQGHDAWGHIVAEQYPGLITGTHQDFEATGQTMTLSYSGSVSDTIGYKYDSFGNLILQTRTAQSVTNTETYAYDNLQRLTQATRSIGGIVTYGYSPSGNITQKSDYAGSYTYGGNGCGPHAASAAGAHSYTCDVNGNVIDGAIKASYDADNHPRSITRIDPPAGTMTWGYSPNGMAVETSSQPTRYFGPNGYEQVGAVKQVHELGPVIVTRTSGGDQVTVVLRDRLGSTIATMDSNVPTGRMYDAFGKARNGDMSNRPNGTLNLPDTIHGFTKHDHADDVQLIHMGGRVYDYSLGRFLQVDPIIQNPANSQSLNPYSYIGNNPLSGKDPTGYTATCGAGMAMAADNSGCESLASRIDGSSVASSATSISSSNSGAVSTGGIKGPGGQNTQNVRPENAGDPKMSGLMLAQNAVEPPERAEETETTGGVSGRAARERGIAPAIEPLAEGSARVNLDKAKRSDPNFKPEETISSLGNNNPIDQAAVLRARQDATANKLLEPLRNETDEVVRQARGGVYLLRDPVTGEVMRSGRTNDFNRRASEHGNNPELGGLEFEQSYKTDSYKQQRGLEQITHEQYQPPLNKISPISPTNPRRQEYIDAAHDYLKERQ